MDIEMEFLKLRDDFERLKKRYDDLLLNLDSDNIAEIDFSRTRVKNPKALIKKLSADVLENDGAATQSWVIDNFEPKGEQV